MTISFQGAINRASEILVEASVMGAAGYLGSYMFNVVDPVHGAVFCAISSVVSKITDLVFGRIFNGEGANNASKFVGKVLSTATSVGAAAYLATYAGFSISLGAGVVLTASMVALLGLTVLGNASRECLAAAAES